MTIFITRMPSVRHLPARLLWIVPVFLLLMVAQPASAHTEFVRSDPTAGATLASAPQQVTIFFSGLLDIDGSSITVVDASGATVSQGATTLSPTDQKALVVSLKSGLGNGTYTVNWTAKSEDGHPSSDSFAFTVGAVTQAVPSATTQLPATGTSPDILQLVLVAIGLVVAGFSVRAKRFVRAGK